MDTCAKCGAGLGVGRFCLNCGHRIGAPVPMPEDGWAQDERPSELRIRHRSPEEPVTEPPVAPTPYAQDEQVVGRDAGAAWLPGQTVADDGPQRLHWGAWVLGALALVAAVLLALSFLGEGGSTATDDEAGDAPTTAEASSSGGAGARIDDGGAMPTGPVVDVARGARLEVPATAPPTTDLDGTLVSYQPRRMVDGVRRTAWRMPGDGTGAQITLFLDRRAVITQVGLVNGYARKVAGVDWYPNNRRILAVTWTFDDGTSVQQVLQEKRRLQLMDIEPVRTRSVILTLDRVTIPGSGGFGRDYTTISSVVLKGKRAG